MIAKDAFKSREGKGMQKRENSRNSNKWIMHENQLKKTIKLFMKYINILNYIKIKVIHITIIMNLF